MWPLVFIILFIFVFYVKCVKPLYYWDERNVSNVRGWPIIGKQGPIILKKMSPLQWMKEAYKEFPNKRYNGNTQFNRQVLVVRDPTLIKEITIKHFENFVNRINIISKEVDPLIGNSLIFLRDQEWKSMRCKLSPAFTLHKMKTMYELILETSNQFCNFFLTKSSNTIAVDTGDVATRFANDVIATCAFDIKCNSLKDKQNSFYAMGKVVSNLSFSSIIKVFLYTLFKPIFKIVTIRFFSNRVNNFFKSIIHEKISLRKKYGNTRQDMIHLLMEAQKGTLKHSDNFHETAGFATVDGCPEEKSTVQKNITEEDIVAQCLTFFFGGISTVTETICCMSYELAVNPCIQSKLRKEVDSTFQRCNGKFSYNDILEMKYLDMVVSETLRKWPPVPVIQRECQKDFILSALTPEEPNLKVEAGVGVIIPVIGIHLDEKFYPNPEKFDPERFNEENKKNIHEFSYIPFGSGPRSCIASRFALLEIKTFFATLLSNFEIVAIEKTEVPNNSKKQNLSSTGGFWVGYKARPNMAARYY